MSDASPDAGRSPILYEVAAGVALITLNRPDKLNAFTADMLRQYNIALRDADRDERVRCLLVGGSGRGFSAGQDLASIRGRDDGERADLRGHLERTYNRAIRRMREIEKPIIGAVNGVAAGAGMSVALACDLRLAAESARFIQSFSGVGLVPDSGSTWFLPRLVGPAVAYELAITARPVTSGEALNLRLVNHVFPDDRFADEAREYAERIAAGPTRAYGLTKRAMNRAWLFSLDQSLTYEAQLQQVAGETDDHQQGVAAFLEKRRPRFQGR